MTIYNNLVNWTKKKVDQYKSMVSHANPSSEALSGLGKSAKSLWETLSTGAIFIKSLIFTATGLAKVPYRAGKTAAALYTALAAEDDQTANQAWNTVNQETSEMKVAMTQCQEQGKLALSSGYDSLGNAFNTGVNLAETTLHAGHATLNGIQASSEVLGLDETPKLIMRAAQVFSKVGKALNQKIAQQFSSFNSYLPAFTLATANDSQASESKNVLKAESSELELTSLTRTLKK